MLPTRVCKTNCEINFFIKQGYYGVHFCYINLYLEVFEASLPKNWIVHVTFYVVFKKYVAKAVNFCLNRLFLCIADLDEA